MTSYFDRLPGRLAAAALSLGLYTAAVPAMAAGDNANDAVVARVNGHEIRESEVEATIANLPPQYAALPHEDVYSAVLQRLIDQQIVASQARKEGLLKDEAVQQTLKHVENQVLEQAYMQNIVDRKLTDEVLKRRYEEEKKTLPRRTEVRARHILVPSKDEALAIIKQLENGADFAKLAREKSIDPSKADGGDLGYFTRDQMVAPFSEAAFSLREGEITKQPVHTRFGWHVIKVEDIRKAEPPSFAEAKDEIRRKMADAIVEKELKDLRSTAKVVRLDPAPVTPPLQPAQ